MSPETSMSQARFAGQRQITKVHINFRPALFHENLMTDNLQKFVQTTDILLIHNLHTFDPFSIYFHRFGELSLKSFLTFSNKVVFLLKHFF